LEDSYDGVGIARAARDLVRQEPDRRLFRRPTDSDRGAGRARRISAGDFAQLGVNIKKAIMAYPTDPGVREDMLELYDKAYELRGYQAIPADWSAPSGITWLSVGVKKRYDPVKGNVRYRMDVYADMTKGQEVQQVQLIRFPGEVIADNSGNNGYFDASETAGIPNFWLGADYHGSPNADGMYQLNIQIKGQEMVHGWFLVSKMNASESPVVTVPRWTWRSALRPRHSTGTTLSPRSIGASRDAKFT